MSGWGKKGVVIIWRGRQPSVGGGGVGYMWGRERIHLVLIAEGGGGGGCWAQS